VKKHSEPERSQPKQEKWAETLCDRFEDLSRPERRDAAENRQRILETARQLFTESGVEKVTMHQIAKAAGIGQGTLYRRYANKGDLCFALLRASFAELCDEVDQSLANTAASQSRLAQLDDLLKRLVDFIENQIPLIGVIETANSAKHKSPFRNPLYEWAHQTVSRLLQEAIAQSEILPLDPVYTADALLATLNAEMYLFQRTDRGFTPEQILQGIRWIYIERLRISKY
jgi:AcrR family transcriptional regulator